MKDWIEIFQERCAWIEIKEWKNQPGMFFSLSIHGLKVIKIIQQVWLPGKEGEKFIIIHRNLNDTENWVLWLKFFSWYGLAFFYGTLWFRVQEKIYINVINVIESWRNFNWLNEVFLEHAFMNGTSIQRFFHFIIDVTLLCFNYTPLTLLHVMNCSRWCFTFLTSKKTWLSS